MINQNKNKGKMNRIKDQQTMKEFGERTFGSIFRKIGLNRSKRDTLMEITSVRKNSNELNLITLFY